MAQNLYHLLFDVILIWIFLLDDSFRGLFLASFTMIALTSQASKLIWSFCQHPVKNCEGSKLSPTMEDMRFLSSRRITGYIYNRVSSMSIMFAWVLLVLQVLKRRCRVIQVDATRIMGLLNRWVGHRFFLFCFVSLNNFIYLFMRDRERQRENQASSREPDVEFDPRTPGLHPELKADAQPLSHSGILGTRFHNW